MEEWLPVVGTDLPYDVSREGQVRSLRYDPPRHLQPQVNSSGYLRVALKIDGKTRWRGVHRLVAAAFIGPAPAGTEVNHRNGNKNDNSVENLEYIDHGDNILHFCNQRDEGAWVKQWAVKPEVPRYTKPRPEPKERVSERRKLTADDVAAITRRILAGEKTRALAAEYRVAQNTIWRISRGLTYNSKSDRAPSTRE